MPRLPTLLAAGLALLAGSAVTPALAEPLSADQKKAVEQVIHDYLLQHPDVLMEALQAAREKSEQEAVEQARRVIAEKRTVLLADPNSPVGGNAQGDVTIVEFFDYRCPYCKQVEPSLEALLKEDRKLRIVYKEFPILGPESVVATRAALAARRQGKYDAFHHAMMSQKGQINEAEVMRIAASIGLDAAKLKSDMAAGEIDDLIKRNYDLAEALDIQGTPAFIVGDTLAPGAATIETLRKLIAAARKPG
jgi:protein-disulfide isomerase